MEGDITQLSGHWHVYTGESLKSIAADPMCVFLDAESESDLQAGNKTAWKALISLTERWNAREP